MSADACTLALKNTLSEIRNVCPEISNAFILRENGEIVTQVENTNVAAVGNAHETFRAIAEKGDVLGGMESITFQGRDAKVNFIQFDDLYVATVMSNDADERAVTNLEKVMIPTTLKLVQNFAVPVKDEPQGTSPTPVISVESEIIEVQPVQIEAREFTVEGLPRLGGFGAASEMAFIDSALIAEWTEIYGINQVGQIVLESPENGKSLQCSFKPFKDSKYDNRGIIQLSDRMQTELSVHKGNQVLIKPIIKRQDEIETNPSKTEERSEMPTESSKQDQFTESGRFNQNTQASQFMVENLRGIGGLLGNPDYVRIDNAMIARWSDMYDGKQITEVVLEDAIFGKKIRTKFQPIKDAQFDGKGVIQLPEKIQAALRTSKGSLVTVKPVVE